MTHIIIGIIIVLISAPILIKIIHEITALLHNMRIGMILFLSVIGILAFITVRYSSIGINTDEPPKLEYSRNLRLADDPYEHMIKLVKHGDLNIKPGANVIGLRTEIANIIPIVLEAYASVMPRGYIPTITSGNDSEVHAANSKHYENLAIDWRTSDITYAQALKITRIIKRELAPVGQYWVAFEDDHIHIHYNKLTALNKYKDIIISTAKRHDVAVSLVMGVIHRESGFNPLARSSAGAEGLMQLMPGTARDLGVVDSFNPAQNIEGGTKYLKNMLQRYDNSIELALAAYNSGPRNIDNAIRNSGSNDWQVVQHNLVTASIHQQETIAYVKKITTYNKLYAVIYA